MLPDVVVAAALAGVATGASVPSVFVTGGADDGADVAVADRPIADIADAGSDIACADFAGAVSADFVSLTGPTPASVGVEGAVAVTAGAEAAISAAGGLAAATDATVSGQRCP